MTEQAPVAPRAGTTRGTKPYDALLLVSFGGPEAPEHVVPFLQNVTRGRGIPEERLRVVGQHYFDRGGKSPINDQCRALIAELESALERAAIDLPVYWGNRNWTPFLDDTVAQMRRDGVRRALALVTSAYSSYSGCRQYRENIAASVKASEQSGGELEIEKARVFFNHPGFIEPMVDNVADALGRARAQTAGDVHVFFTAHSIPESLARSSAYEQQLRNAASLIADRVHDMAEWSLAWQSRSGPPQVPWLEPDICDAIRSSADSPTSAVVVVPLGFISDHMEVIQDLDTDAAAAAQDSGLVFERAATVGTDPRFVDMFVSLVREHISGETPVGLGELGLCEDQCSAHCCPPPQRPKRPAGG